MYMGTYTIPMYLTVKFHAIWHEDNLIRAHQNKPYSKAGLL